MLASHISLKGSAAKRSIARALSASWDSAHTSAARSCAPGRSARSDMSGSPRPIAGRLLDLSEPALVRRSMYSWSRNETAAFQLSARSPRLRASAMKPSAWSKLPRGAHGERTSRPRSSPATVDEAPPRFRTSPPGLPSLLESRRARATPRNDVGGSTARSRSPASVAICTSSVASCTCSLV